jgi:hypothetical protein
MIRKLGYITALLLAVLLLAAIVTVAQEPAAAGEPAGAEPAQSLTGEVVAPQSEVLATTYITVTSTDDDYQDGYSTKCSDPDVPPEECTLRRAINQAYGLSSGDRPVYIIFDIPETDPGYDDTLGVWEIEVSGSSAYDFRELNGQTILDGSTQPGGRSEGPKIIVDGLGNHNRGLILRYNDNVVRGLAMQNFETAHVTLSSDDNTVEDCWFGLSPDGMTLSSGSDTDPEGGSAIDFAAGSDGNAVQNNVFAGFFGAAVAIRGDNNVFAGNLVGTRADGTVPIPAAFDKHPCLSGAWTGGSGITVSDDNNQIGGPTVADGNLFAGLFLDVGPETTQGPAMDVIGTGHLIQNNVIGLDVNDDLVGVCGRGMDFGGGPSGMQVLDNTVVETGLSAVLMNNWQCNGNTLYTNLIYRELPWPKEQGDNNFPEDAIAYGPNVPAELRNFEPARVTEVDGTAVSGTSGEGSSCPLCTIEIFLDDTDDVTETLQSLATVTANASGNWNATLPAPLEAGQGLRTMSTVPDSFTIIGLDAGTTSNLSDLYGAVYRVLLPIVTRND